MMYLKNRFSLLAALGAVVFLAACSMTEVKTEAPGINEVAPNSKFRIILPEDHTQGYSWQLSGDYDKNVADYTNSAWHGNEKGVYFHFEAGQKGQTVLTFVSRKYRDTLNVKSFIIKILDK